MLEIKRPYKSLFQATAYFPGNASLTVTYTLQCITTTSTNYLKFWNATTSGWVVGITANACPAVVSNPGLYMAQINHAALTGYVNDDLFAVTVHEAANSYNDFFLLRFGDVVEAATIKTTDFVVPPRKTVSRITDQHLRYTSYDAPTGGNVILQVDVVQDITGTQPEETQTSN